jgi:hypothetical protein
VELAYYPDVLYLIASLMDAVPVVKAFRIADGSVEEEELIVQVN